MLDDTADGRNLANQLRLVVYPTIYRALYVPGDARFLPSTVAPVDFGDAKLWVIAHNTKLKHMCFSQNR